MTDNGPDTSGQVLTGEITGDSPFTLPGFFAALSEEKLLAGRCEECDKRLVPPRPACYRCGSTRIDVEEQPHTGEILTYTEVYRPPPPYAHLAPITIGIVEFDSGARMTGRVDAAYDDVSIGMPVRMTVRKPEDLTTETALRQEQDWPLHIFEVEE